MQEGKGDNNSSENSPLMEIEEFFPKNKAEIISNSIADNDTQTIHHKLHQYPELDS